MSELKWFRLLLFATALLLVIGTGVWSYSSFEAHLAHQQVVRFAEQSTRAIDHCLAKDRNATIDQCKNLYTERLVDEYAEDRTRYEERAEAALWFSSIGIGCLVTAFYGLRWALTGRVRPLWLLSGKRSSE